MNIWIIILSSIGVLLYLISGGFFNYVKNTPIECMKAKYGVSIPYIIGGIIRLFSYILLFVDFVLVVIKLLC